MNKKTSKLLKLLFAFVFLFSVGLIMTACGSKTYELTLEGSVEVVKPEKLDLKKVKEKTDVTVRVKDDESKGVENFLVNDEDKKAELKNLEYTFKMLKNTKVVVLLKGEKGGSTTSESALRYRTTGTKQTNLHPWKDQIADKTEIMSYTCGVLYRAGIDWDATIKNGVQKDDFENSDKFIGKYIPTLAEELPVPLGENNEEITNVTRETVEKKWRLKIRKDLKFEDGTPINANTFIYTFQRILDPDEANERGTIFFDGDVKVVGTEKYFKQKIGTPKKDVFGNEIKEVKKDENGNPIKDISGQPVMETVMEPGTPMNFDEIAGIKKVDDNTIDFQFVSPVTQFKATQFFSTYYLSPVSEEKYSLKKDGKVTYGSKENWLISSGPFKIKEWEESHILLVRNENYLPKEHADAIQIQEVYIYQEENPNTLRTLFESGKVDDYVPIGEAVKAYKNHKSYRQPPTSYMFGFEFNAGRKKDGTPRVTSVKELRQAIYHAINREEWSNGPQRPAAPLADFVSNETFVTFEDFETSQVYVTTDEYKQFVNDTIGSTHGYNEQKAKQLFQTALTRLEESNLIQQGGVVEVSVLVYRAPRNEQSLVLLEDLIKKGLGKDLAKRIKLVPNYGETSEAFTQKANSKEYDLRLIIPGGGAVNAVATLSRYTSITPANSRMGIGLENTPFETTKLDVKVPQTVAELRRRLDNENKKAKPDENLVTQYNEYNNKVKADNETLSLTIVEWIKFMELINNFYEGKNEETVRVANVLQAHLIEHLPFLPLNYRMEAQVFSSRVNNMFKKYNLVLGYGGIEYIRIVEEDKLDLVVALDETIKTFEAALSAKLPVAKDAYHVELGKNYVSEATNKRSQEQLNLAKTKLNDIKAKGNDKLTADERKEVLALIENINKVVAEYKGSTGLNYTKLAKETLKKNKDFKTEITVKPTREEVSAFKGLHATQETLTELEKAYNALNEHVKQGTNDDVNKQGYQVALKGHVDKFNKVKSNVKPGLNYKLGITELVKDVEHTLFYSKPGALKYPGEDQHIVAASQLEVGPREIFVPVGYRNLLAPSVTFLNQLIKDNFKIDNKDVANAQLKDYFNELNDDYEYILDNLVNLGVSTNRGLLQRAIANVENVEVEVTKDENYALLTGNLNKVYVTKQELVDKLNNALQKAKTLLHNEVDEQSILGEQELTKEATEARDEAVKKIKAAHKELLEAFYEVLNNSLSTSNIVSLQKQFANIEKQKEEKSLLVVDAVEKLAVGQKYVLTGAWNTFASAKNELDTFVTNIATKTQAEIEAQFKTSNAALTALSKAIQTNEKYNIPALTEKANEFEKKLNAAVVINKTVLSKDQTIDKVLLNEEDKAKGTKALADFRAVLGKANVTQEELKKATIDFDLVVKTFKFETAKDNLDSLLKEAQKLLLAKELANEDRTSQETLNHDDLFYLTADKAKYTALKSTVDALKTIDANTTKHENFDLASHEKVVNEFKNVVKKVDLVKYFEADFEKFVLELQKVFVGEKANLLSVHKATDEITYNQLADSFKALLKENVSKENVKNRLATLKTNLETIDKLSKGDKAQALKPAA